MDQRNKNSQKERELQRKLEESQKALAERKAKQASESESEVRSDVKSRSEERSDVKSRSEERAKMAEIELKRRNEVARQRRVALAGIAEPGVRSPVSQPEYYFEDEEIKPERVVRAGVGVRARAAEPEYYFEDEQKKPERVVRAGVGVRARAAEPEFYFEDEQKKPERVVIAGVGARAAEPEFYFEDEQKKPERVVIAGVGARGNTAVAWDKTPAGVGARGKTAVAGVRMWDETPVGVRGKTAVAGVRAGDETQAEKEQLLQKKREEANERVRMARLARRKDAVNVTNLFESASHSSLVSDEMGVSSNPAALRDKLVINPNDEYEKAKAAISDQFERRRGDLAMQLENNVDEKERLVAKLEREPRNGTTIEKMFVVIEQYNRIINKIKKDILSLDLQFREDIEMLELEYRLKVGTEVRKYLKYKEKYLKLKNNH